MAEIELLTVQQAFQLQGIGLAIVPDFSVPKAGWKDGTYQVLVVKPNGQQIKADANFHVWHFNIPDPSVPHDKRWRVIVSFPSLTKDDLPAGSRILSVPSAEIALLLQSVRVRSGP
jgi:hypothetical protein